ncbi:hypothetical protein GCM10010471_23760 [Leucobacter komagatae]
MDPDDDNSDHYRCGCARFNTEDAGVGQRVSGNRLHDRASGAQASAHEKPKGDAWQTLRQHDEAVVVIGGQLPEQRVRHCDRVDVAGTDSEPCNCDARE